MNKSFLILVVGLALTGCTRFTVNPIPGRVSLSFQNESIYDFGSVEVGQSSSYSAILTNTGDVEVRIKGELLLTGPFRIDADSCGRAIAPSASCTVDVTFSPSEAGPQEGQLSGIFEAEKQEVALSHGLAGTGVPLPPQVSGIIFSRRSDSELFQANSSLSIQQGDSVVVKFEITGNPEHCRFGEGSGQEVSHLQELTLAPAISKTYFLNCYRAGTAERDRSHKSLSVVVETPPLSVAIESKISPESNYQLRPQVEIFPYDDINLKFVATGNPSNCKLFLNQEKLFDRDLGHFVQNLNLTVRAETSSEYKLQCSRGEGPTAQEAAYTLNVVVKPTTPVENAVPGKSLVFSPTTLEFPDTVRDQTSSPLKASLINNGTEAVGVSKVILFGYSMQENLPFSVTSDCVRTLYPGQSCEVSVRFNPRSIHQYNNNHIRAYGDNLLQPTLPVRGNGVSTSGGAAQYVIYHGSVFYQGNPYNLNDAVVRGCGNSQTFSVAGNKVYLSVREDQENSFTCVFTVGPNEELLGVMSYYSSGLNRAARTLNINLEVNGQVNGGI